MRLNATDTIYMKQQMAIMPQLILIRMLDPRLRAREPKIIYTSNITSLVVSHGATNGY